MVVPYVPTNPVFFHCSITFWWLNYSSFWWHSISGWWFGTFCVFPYIGNNHPNWLIFFRRVETTNQYKSWDVYHLSTGDSNFAPIVERYVAGSHSCKDTWGYLRVFHPILFPSRILAWMFHWDWDYIFPLKKNNIHIRINEGISIHIPWTFPILVPSCPVIINPMREVRS